MKKPVYYDVSLLTEHDIYLFKEGNHFELYNKLGCHRMTVAGKEGALFAVWAPNAEYVSVVGDFNNWDQGAHPLQQRDDFSGIWEGFIPGAQKGFTYKYHIGGPNGFQADKGDPFAFLWEVSPKSASVVWDLEYTWGDQEWMTHRNEKNALDAPMSIYEVHLGSWKRVPEEGWRSLSYLEMAETLPAYVKEMGFTHVEFMPVMEHPFFGSWGYQVLGYFAPSSRYGTPGDFMYLVDRLHQAGVGVILDWVPSHFPTDGHGLSLFDGTNLYEHSDAREGFHPDWNCYIFNLGRYEVRAFLISSAHYWLDKYHIDGLRVDAVASMLYRNYSREDGDWIPNKYGGKENLEAIDFLRKLNESVYEAFPDTQTMAEESTDWPMVSRPAYLGGLGFGLKWNMGWMHDTLDYIAHDPVYRKYHHNALTFSIWYAFFENFVLPLSHDEVVYGKGSLIGKMPGDMWQQFAGLRLLYAYMYAHPGKKLLFMGAEIGQRSEWAHDGQLEWNLLKHPLHNGVNQFLKDLNRLLIAEKSLHECDFSNTGFEWIDFHDAESSVIVFMRRGEDENDVVVAAMNFTPIVRYNYCIGVPFGGDWMEILNSDAAEYGGSGVGNAGQVRALDPEGTKESYTLNLTLPPLGAVYFKPLHNKK
ncbi:1,4-alpha-glucan branching protein GlgB [Desulfovibrio inopinatus]|uniref:1,4-alpha-glucan branching protein GlgB n=1 Tax=Desulfovibrio inopinatus TaxID=102109 RepID=UPI00040D0219